MQNKKEKKNATPQPQPFPFLAWEKQKTTFGGLEPPKRSPGFIFIDAVYTVLHFNKAAANVYYRFLQMLLVQTECT